MVQQFGCRFGSCATARGPIVQARDTQKYRSPKSLTYYFRSIQLCDTRRKYAQDWCSNMQNVVFSQLCIDAKSASRYACYLKSSESINSRYQVYNPGSSLKVSNQRTPGPAT